MIENRQFDCHPLPDRIGSDRTGPGQLIKLWSKERQRGKDRNIIPKYTAGANHMIYSRWLQVSMQWIVKMVNILWSRCFDFMLSIFMRYLWHARWSVCFLGGKARPKKNFSHCLHFLYFFSKFARFHRFFNVSMLPFIIYSSFLSSNVSFLVYFVEQFISTISCSNCSKIQKYRQLHNLKCEFCCNFL